MVSRNYVTIEGSERDEPLAAHAVGATKADERVEVSVYLKNRDADPLLNTQAITAGEKAAAPQAQTRAELRQRRTESHAGDIAKVIEFANAAGLTVVSQDPERRLVKLAGSASKMEAAFRTELHYYHDGQKAFRARSGTLSVPEDVAGVIEAVLGLDTRPQAKPRLVAHLGAQAVTGHFPSEVAKAYDFPAAGTESDQRIALIELGGGFREQDNQIAFGAMKVKAPTIIPVSVGTGANNPGLDPNSDSEVALDIQVAGAACPGAPIIVYFSDNSTQGFVDAVSRAVHDSQNKPTVISISWGSPEAQWNAQSSRAMTAALADAARLGIPVFAAAGDHLATDGLANGRANCDFPASSPLVVGCGGTMIAINPAGAISSERVWNDGSEGTGGGISDRFAIPPYQEKVALPGSVNGGRRGRGVPDLAADAAPSSGYRVVVGGLATVVGGTSAVAPLQAGLMALILEQCNRPTGLIHPLLYGNPTAFRPVIQGDNKDNGIGYDAAAGWDACTGLGVPDGQKLLRVFVQILGAASAAASKDIHVAKAAASQQGAEHKAPAPTEPAKPVRA